MVAAVERSWQDRLGETKRQRKSESVQLRSVQDGSRDSSVVRAPDS